MVPLSNKRLRPLDIFIIFEIIRFSNNFIFMPMRSIENEYRIISRFYRAFMEVLLKFYYRRYKSPGSKLGRRNLEKRG